MKRNNLRTIGAIFAGGGSILAAIVAGIMLLTCVYALPTEPMRHNALRGIENYETEGEHYNLAIDYDATGLDGFTEAIMVGNAIDGGTGNPLRDALTNCRREYEGHNKVESLSAAVHGKAGGTEQAYPRYWHGYLVLLKPLLFLFSLSEIRMLNMGVQMIAMVLTLLLFSAWMVGAKTYEKSWGWMLYLWLGILTAYFDFLTYPPTAMGILLLLELLLTQDAPKDAMKKILLRSTAWVCGYGGMWAGKWISASLLTGENVIANALTAVEGRTSSVVSGKKINILQVVWHNVRLYINPYFLVVSLCLVFLLIYVCRNKGFAFHLDAARSVPYAFVGLYPFVWYSCLKNHSIIHPFMEHKNLTISVMAALCVAVMSLHKKEVGKTGKNPPVAENI